MIVVVVLFITIVVWIAAGVILVWVAGGLLGGGTESSVRPGLRVEFDRWALPFPSAHFMVVHFRG